jgi:serine/threonine-protein kinase
VYFLAMELVEGATVAELLAGGALPEALVAHIGAQVCDALGYAHERFGLVHRDVTPRNVMADARGHVRLLDFGIAAPLARTAEGGLFGSPGYMSPEQARGGALGAQSDLFSLGTVLYEALTGRAAFAGTDPGAPLELAPLSGLSAELAQLVRALLATDPAARPGSAAEVAARLRTWLARNHPEGVAQALGARVEQARARSEQEPAADGPVRIESRPNGAARVTRSIATSKQLNELLAGSTEPLARPSPTPSGGAAETAEPAPAPPGRRTRNTLALGMLALAFAAGALILIERPGGERDAASRADAQSSRLARSATQPSAETAAKGLPATGPAPDRVATALASPLPDPAADAIAAAADSAARSGRKDAGAAQSPAAAEPAAVRARLSVNALPWAELRIDGRALGTTPQRAVAIGAGHHVLQLECPPLGRSARVALKLAQGEHRRVLVDLNTDPPTVTEH